MRLSADSIVSFGLGWHPLRSDRGGGEGVMPGRAGGQVEPERFVQMFQWNRMVSGLTMLRSML